MPPSMSYIDTSPLNIITSLSDTDDRKELTEEQKAELVKRNEQRDFLQNIAKIAYQHASDSRRRYDYEWMVRDMFRRGYQFSKYQPTTQTVILASRQTARIPINIVNAQMRSIASQVTSFRPKFEVMPRYGESKESQTNARYSGKLLDYYFDKLGMKKLIKETVLEGLMFSVGGPWEVVFDEEKKEIVIWKRDPYDFYFDPLATNTEDAEFQISAVRRPLAEVIYNDEYDPLARSEIRGGEGRLAASEYKQFMLTALKYVTQFNRAESPELILFDGKFRIRDKETGKPHLRRVVWTEQNSIPLLYEDLDTNEYDTCLYQADLNPNEVYGEGWMKHVMPLNRVLNSLESSVFDYNYKVAKGRIVVDKDSGIRAIHNIHGEIISKKRGAEVRALDMPPLPIATASQIERIYKYMEDISGVHDPSLGRVPPGSRSGVMLAEMKQSDSTNQDYLVDNLEDFLTLVAKKVLRKISENLTVPQVIQDLGYKEEDAKYFAIVGKKFQSKKEENKDKFRIGTDFVDLARIADDNNIRVTIGSWLGYTKEMMQEKTIKLLQLGAINQETFLKLWEFGNIDAIVQKTRQEQMLKARLNQKPGGMQEVDPYIENDMMVLEGKPVMPDPHDDHQIHIMVHQEALGQGADDLVTRHIAAHQMYLESETGIQSQLGTDQASQGQPGESGIAPGDQMRQDQIAQQQQQQQGQGLQPLQGGASPGGMAQGPVPGM